jgi:hypothetical protein
LNRQFARQHAAKCLWVYRAARFADVLAPEAPRKTNEARSHEAIETARPLHSDLRATREAEAPEALATALTGLASVQPFSGYSLYAARKRLQDAI